jgi:hypothetical protein
VGQKVNRVYSQRNEETLHVVADGVSPNDLRKKRRGHLEEERGWKEKDRSREPCATLTNNISIPTNIS